MQYSADRILVTHAVALPRPPDLRAFVLAKSAGTDCGLGPWVGHPSACWAKFEAMAEGARRATKILWGRT
jgi:methionine synthase II (cobalamin-independent)